MIKSHNFENSSMLSASTYDTETKELSVTFINGRIYTYVDVPELIFNDLITMKSAGKYFNSIKKELVQK